jgi:hypothetical protein
MIEDVKKRLLSLDYKVVEIDTPLLNILIEKVNSETKSFCGVTTIPDESKGILVDMVTGEFLMTMKNSGQDLKIDLDSAVSSVQTGDTNVTMAKGILTPEQRLDRLINYLMKERKKELVDIRRITW